MDSRGKFFFTVLSGDRIVVPYRGRINGCPFFFFFNQKNPSALSRRDEKKGWVVSVRVRARASVSCHLIQCIFVLRSTIVHAGHPRLFALIFVISFRSFDGKYAQNWPYIHRLVFRSVCIQCSARATALLLRPMSQLTTVPPPYAHDNITTLCPWTVVVWGRTGTYRVIYRTRPTGPLLLVGVCVFSFAAQIIFRDGLAFCDPILTLYKLTEQDRRPT